MAFSYLLCIKLPLIHYFQMYIMMIDILNQSWAVNCSRHNLSSLFFFSEFLDLYSLLVSVP